MFLTANSYTGKSKEKADVNTEMTHFYVSTCSSKSWMLYWKILNIKQTFC